MTCPFLQSDKSSSDLEYVECHLLHLVWILSHLPCVFFDLKAQVSDAECCCCLFCLGVLEKNELVYAVSLSEVEDCPLLCRSSAKSYQEVRRRDYSSQVLGCNQEGKSIQGRRQKTRARPGH